MTLDQFITKWNGKKADWDNAYGGQCVDLFRFYVHEVMGKDQPKPVVGAADFFTNYDIDPNLKNNFDKILNTPVGVPKKGDVILWNKKAGGGFGHVGIFIEGDANRFKSFDQNWRALNVSEPTEHNYTNVLGWLRPKENDMSELCTYLGVTSDAEAKTKLKEHLGEVNGKSNWGMTGDTGGYLGSERKKNQVLNEQVENLIAQNNSHVNEILALQNENKQLREDLANCDSSESEWVANGKQVTTVAGNVTTTVNYAKV